MPVGDRSVAPLLRIRRRLPLFVDFCCFLGLKGVEIDQKAIYAIEVKRKRVNC